MTLALRYAARSDQGLVRTNNEDSVYAGPRLLAVADGMGGHAAGEVASNVVITSLAYLDEDRRADDLIAELRDATANANRHLRDLVAEDPDLEGMGTTLTGLLFAGNRIGVVHVGDSRGYLLRGGQLSQITHDDTFVQALIDEGRLTEEEAHSHPQRSLILRALNGTDVEPDLSIREARVGDRYLLCSDGLSDVVSAETMLEALQLPDPQQCADRLVELALRGGGPDNVTCIVADVIDTGFGDDLPVIGGAFIDPTEPGARPSGGDSSPAERAAQMTRGAEPQHVDRPRRHRRWLRRLVFTLVVLVVLIGGTGGFYAWTQSQYFVGRSGDEVAIFRGVNTDFGPLKFYKVASNTPIKMTDLTPVAQSQVESGITAHSQSGAQEIVGNLLTQLLPPCPTATPTPSPTVSAPHSTATHPRGSGSASTVPATPSSPSPSPTASQSREG